MHSTDAGNEVSLDFGPGALTYSFFEFEDIRQPASKATLPNRLFVSPFGKDFRLSLASTSTNNYYAASVLPVAAATTAPITRGIPLRRSRARLPSILAFKGSLIFSAAWNAAVRLRSITILSSCSTCFSSLPRVERRHPALTDTGTSKQTWGLC